jgi:hypothetical protein
VIVERELPVILLVFTLLLPALPLEYYIDAVIELYNRDATTQNIISTFTELQGKLTISTSILMNALKE